MCIPLHSPSTAAGRRAHDPLKSPQPPAGELTTLSRVRSRSRRIGTTLTRVRSRSRRRAVTRSRVRAAAAGEARPTQESAAAAAGIYSASAEVLLQMQESPQPFSFALRLLVLRASLLDVGIRFALTTWICPKFGLSWSGFPQGVRRRAFDPHRHFLTASAGLGYVCHSHLMSPYIIFIGERTRDLHRCAHSDTPHRARFLFIASGSRTCFEMGTAICVDVLNV